MDWFCNLSCFAWNKIARTLLIVLVLAGVAVLASSCAVSPRLQARQGSATPDPSAPQRSPVVEISPREGGAGTRITVQGNSWTPGHTVFVRLEDLETGRTPALDQASAIVTDSGDFSAKFTYPFDPRWLSQPQVAIVVLDPVNAQRVSATFRILGATGKPTETPTPVSSLGATIPTLVLPTAGPATPTSGVAVIIPTPLIPTLAVPTAVLPTPLPTLQSSFSTSVPPPTATAALVGQWAGAGRDRGEGGKETKLRGTVEQLPAAGLVGSWVIDGRQVVVAPDTKIKTKSRAGAVGLGTRVEVKGSFAADGAYRAIEIKRKD